MVFRSRPFLLSGIVILLSSSTLFGQDYGKLRERVLKLWELRQKGEKLAATELVEPQSRNAFLQSDPPRILKVDPNIAFRFTDDHNRITVTIDADLSVIELGETHVSVEQTWVWRNRNWFLTLDASPKLSPPTDPARSAFFRSGARPCSQI